MEDNKNMSSETPSASQSLPSSGYVVMQTREEKDESSRVQKQYMSQTQTGSNTETIRKCERSEHG